MTKNLRAAHNVLIVWSSQSVLSTQSKEIVALKQHTADLTQQYQQLPTYYEQLC
jgi:hypothetical protein